MCTLRNKASKRGSVSKITLSLFRHARRVAGLIGVERPRVATFERRSDRKLRNELLPHLKFGMRRESCEDRWLQGAWQGGSGEVILMGCALT